MTLSLRRRNARRRQKLYARSWMWMNSRKSCGLTLWKRPQSIRSWISRSSAVSTAGGPNQSANLAGTVGSNLMVGYWGMGEFLYAHNKTPRDVILLCVEVTVELRTRAVNIEPFADRRIAGGQQNVDSHDSEGARPSQRVR